MRIGEFLREDVVVADLSATDKRGVLEELCGVLARAYPPLPAGRLLEVLQEREKLGSTGIGEGVAIPHAKLGSVPGLLAAFGRSVRGIDFAAVDGKPAQLFFVLVAPENSAGIHLKALARISRLLRSPALRQRIFATEGRSALHRLLVDEDARE